MGIIKKKFKLGKRLGAGIHEKCQSQKFMLSQARGGRQSKRRRRPTDYGYALLDKQRVRYAYGLKEKQFAKYVKNSLKVNIKETTPAKRLFETLETRLDNVVYRAGIATTRPWARQLVSHGHFLVNGKKIDVPSHIIKTGDVITLREGSKSKKVFADLTKRLKGQPSPSWLNVNASEATVKIQGVPTDPDPFFNFQSVVEFYSR